jgi:hypothetical protein
MLGSSCIAAQLAASQEELGSIKFVMNKVQCFITDITNFKSF